MPTLLEYTLQGECLYVLLVTEGNKGYPCFCVLLVYWAPVLPTTPILSRVNKSKAYCFHTHLQSANNPVQFMIKHSLVISPHHDLNFKCSYIPSLSWIFNLLTCTSLGQ